MVFLHMHKCGIMVCFAVAVPLPTDVKIPGIPFHLFQPVVDRIHCFLQRFQEVFGVDAAGYDRQVTIRNCRYPLLLTAGSMENQEEILSVLKERNPQPTTVLILPGCNHGNGMYKQTQMYQNAIREFAEQYM